MSASNRRPFFPVSHAELPRARRCNFRPTWDFYSPTPRKPKKAHLAAVFHAQLKARRSGRKPHPNKLLERRKRLFCGPRPCGTPAAHHSQNRNTRIRNALRFGALRAVLQRPAPERTGPYSPPRKPLSSPAIGHGRFPGAVRAAKGYPIAGSRPAPASAIHGTAVASAGKVP